MLPEIRVASPCTADWKKMAGDQRVRHCAQCDLDVYDFSAMTAREIERLMVQSRGQRLCGRLYRRADGTLLTRDCPVGFRVRVKRISRRVGMALAAVMSAGASAAQSGQTRDSSLVQIQPASEIDVVVVDPSGAVIPNVAIHVASKDGRHVLDGITDSSGRFSSALAPGAYVLVTKAFGFKKVETSIEIPSTKPTVVSLQINEELANMGVIVVVDSATAEPISSPGPELLSERSVPSTATPQGPVASKRPSALKRFFSGLGHKVGQ